VLHSDGAAADSESSKDTGGSANDKATEPGNRVGGEEEPHIRKYALGVLN